MDTIFGIIVVFISGLAVSFSIGELASSNALAISLEVYIALFAFKIFLDDLSHFKSPTTQKQKIFGFTISILVWVVLTGAFIAAPVNIERSVYYLIIIILFATVWIAVNHIGKQSTKSDKERRIAWTVINCMHVFSLSTFLVYYDPQFLDYWVYLFVVLDLLVVYDFFKYGTVKRLVKVYSKQGTQKDK